MNSEPIDVMIIGSGFGGAVTALRLAEQGISSVMLERGKRWTVNKEQNTFSTLENPDGRSAWLSDFAVLGEPIAIDKYIGVLELILGNGIAALAGSGVGGGSLVYAGALYQPSHSMFNSIFNNTVDFNEMNNIYYPRVRSVIDPQPIPKNILSRPEYAAARTWIELGEKAGLVSKKIDLGVSWDVVKQELQGKCVPSVTAGEFWYGNNSDAKLSLDKNYLRIAEKSGHLDIQTQQDVVSIEESSDGRYIVTSNEIDQNGNVLSVRTYVVKKLFLAAGSVGTSKLLVKAKARNGLPALNDQVGLHWGNNGDFFSQISDLSKKVISNTCGIVPISIEDHSNHIAPVTVECYADWTQEGQTGLISSVGMATPPAKGKFIYDAIKDDVILNWPANDPDIEKSNLAGAACYERLVEAFGLHKKSVKHVKSGHCKMPGHPHCSSAMAGPVQGGITAHPLGGVVLNHATDNIGTLKNYNGLYAIDGALIPGHTGCTNPALTISALAERNIERILERDF